MLKVKQHKHRGVVIAISIIAVIAAVSVYLYIQKPSSSSVEPKERQAVITKRVSSVKSRMMVVGDVFWSRYTKDAAMRSPLKYSFPFARLNEFHRDQYDAWIGDMECPLANGTQPTSTEEETTLSFNCDPAYLSEAAKWFTAMTLANNHTDNRGVEGFRQTQENLAAHAIQYFGHYDPENVDNICEVISLPARATMNDGSQRNVKLPMAWCGYHGVFKIPTQASVNEISTYAAKLTTVAMPHSGAEYKPAPDEIKTTLYRSMIDAGADAVVGDHPHWVQTTESYKNHLILYSLGNFMFDQQFNREVTRSVGLIITAEVATKDNPDLEAWIKLGKTCEAYHDDCLAKATDQHLKKLQLKLHYSIVVSDGTGRQPHPADANLTADTLQRLRWQQTVAGLGGPYSGE